MSLPTLAIIGPGRAGTAVALGLHRAGYRIAAVHDRHPEHARDLAEQTQASVTRTAAGALELADLTILAVPDAAITALARDLAEYQCSSAGKAVVHLSGAQDRAPLDALKAQGLRTGVFHPLQAFAPQARPTAIPPGTVYGIDADPPLRSTLEQMARDLDGEAFDLEGVDRARYHAAAALVSNFSLTLLADAVALMAEAGVPPPLAQQGLRALLAGTLANLVGRTPAEALTGPIARGDEATVEGHLRALSFDSSLRQLYAQLAERTRRLLAKPGGVHRFTGIHHVQLAMPPGAEERAGDFYAGLLGFEEIPKPPELAARGGRWFRRGAVELHLGVEEPFQPARKAHPALQVHGLEALTQRLISAGLTVTPDSLLDGHRRLHLNDPFGNRIELIEAIRTTAQEHP